MVDGKHEPQRPPPNPMQKALEDRLLQGTPPPDSLKSALLALLKSDQDIQAAIQDLTPLNALTDDNPDPDTQASLFDPDAATGQWIQLLIEKKLQQHIRQDAFRLPLTLL